MKYYEILLSSQNRKRLRDCFDLDICFGRDVKYFTK